MQFKHPALFLLTFAAAGYHTLGLADARLTAFPYEPGVSITGMTGTFSQGAGDALIPFLGQPLTFAYLDPQGVFYSGDEYSASGGLGLRTLHLTPNAILGAYIFGDYDHSRNNHGFWFVSPGIEALTDRFDVSANIYVPVGSEVNDMGTTFATDMGDMRSITFTGHEEVDELIHRYESVGLGGDAEIGYRLPCFKNNTKLYAGIYYFSPDDADAVTGGSARLEVPVASFASLSVSEGYDTLNHNTVKAGLTVDLGGRNTHFHYKPDLTTRVLDPLHRNLAAISGSAHAGPPIEQTEESLGLGVVLDNIWFFRETGTLLSPTALVTAASCTAENPCDFTQNNLTGINAITPSGANLFVESGDYPHLNGPVTVYDGQLIFGRTDGWVMPANNDHRPTLFGSLYLMGNNTVDSIQLRNDPNQIQTTGILLQDNAQDVQVNNTLIGATSNDPSRTYQEGIRLGNNSVLTVHHTTIENFSSGANQATLGIAISGANNVLTIENSAFDTFTTGNSSLTVGIGIENSGNNTVRAVDNLFVLKTSGDNSPAFGFFTNSDHNTIFSEDNTFAMKTFGTGDASAIEAILLGNNNTLTMKNDQAKLTATGDSASAVGVVSGGNDNIINLNNVSIQAQVDGNNAMTADIALFGGDNVQVTIEESQMAATATGNNSNAFGAVANSFGASQNTTFTFVNDHLAIKSLNGTAYGMADPAQAANGDVWSIDAATFNDIRANGFIESCKIKFNGICIN